VSESRFFPAIEFGDNSLRQLLAQFDTPLVEKPGAVLSIALYLSCGRAYSRCGNPASEEDVQ
jgi:hypothetical protein